MATILRGKVTQVLDGTTVVLSPQSAPGPLTITLAGTLQMQPTSLAGALARLDLEKRLAGKWVDCEIMEQRLPQTLVGRMNVIQPNEGLEYHVYC